MKLKKTELAKLAGVTRGTVNNWINRDKKIETDEKGKIDTENSKNLAFLNQKVPHLYNKPDENINDDSENAPGEVNLKDFFSGLLGKKFESAIDNEADIDELSDNDVREYLKIILFKSPKDLLTTAQYKKAEIEKQHKELDLRVKKRKLFTREDVHDHFLTILQFYYDNKRQIPYSTVDEIMNLVKTHDLKARNMILELLDNKYLEEIDKAMELLDNKYNVELKEIK